MNQADVNGEVNHFYKDPLKVGPERLASVDLRFATKNNQAELRKRLKEAGLEKQFIEVVGGQNEQGLVCIPTLGLQGRYYLLSEAWIISLITQEKVAALEEMKKEFYNSSMKEFIDTMIAAITKGGV